MFEELEILMTSNDLKEGRKIHTPNISRSFIINYLSYTSRNKGVAKEFNRFPYSVREKYIKDGLFLNVVKDKAFFWENTYQKKPVELDIPDFKSKVKKHYKWSEKEWRKNISVVLQQKVLLCELLNVENKDRRVLGVKEVIVEKIAKPSKEKKKGGLEAWM